MNKTMHISYIVISILFLWTGFVCAISFMEAWLKFKVPGVDLKTGLSIGKLVFKALNRVEWTLFTLLLFALINNRVNLLEQKYILLIIPVALLIIQTFWLLPKLQLRANLYIENLPVQPAQYHLYYIISEALKIISFLIISFLNIK